MGGFCNIENYRLIANIFKEYIYIYLCVCVFVKTAPF
jgi:hypothetical protein